MANLFSANIYGINGQSLPANQTIGLPSAHVVIRPVVGTVTMMGVAQATIIELLPQGTRVGSVTYHSPTDTATVITDASA